MRIDADTCRDPELLAGEVRRLHAAIASQQTLTDKEREAIKAAIRHYEDYDMDAGCWHAANTLRGLLNRHFPLPDNAPEQDNELSGNT